MSRKYQMQVILCTRRWYHGPIEKLRAWVHGRRTAVHDSECVLYMVFDHDKRGRPVHITYATTMFKNKFSIPLSQAKPYRCGSCIIFDRDTLTCGHRLTKDYAVTEEELENDGVPGWCPFNNGKGLCDIDYGTETVEA